MTGNKWFDFLLFLILFKSTAVFLLDKSPGKVNSWGALIWAAIYVILIYNGTS